MLPTEHSPHKGPVQSDLQKNPQNQDMLIEISQLLCCFSAFVLNYKPVLMTLWINIGPPKTFRVKGQCALCAKHTKLA